jgi:TPP-dependent indolepyruvate ferredoxin oxidoreductase alpha subunit
MYCKEREREEEEEEEEEAYIIKSKEEGHMYCIVSVGCTKMKYREFQRRRYPQATDLL